MRPGDVVVASVCNFSKPWPRKFIYRMQVHLRYCQVRTCPIAIAYRPSMGQILNRFAFVSVSVGAHSHGCISWSIFTKIGTDVRTNKSKNEFVRG